MKIMAKKKGIIIMALAFTLIFIGIIMIYQTTNKQSSTANNTQESQEEVLELIENLYQEEGYKIVLEKKEGDTLIFDKVNLKDNSCYSKYTYNLKTKEILNTGIQSVN